MSLEIKLLKQETVQNVLTLRAGHSKSSPTILNFLFPTSSPTPTPTACGHKYYVPTTWKYKGHQTCHAFSWNFLPVLFPDMFNVLLIFSLSKSLYSLISFKCHPTWRCQLEFLLFLLTLIAFTICQALF